MMIMDGIDRAKTLQGYENFFSDQIDILLGEYVKLIATPIRQLMAGGFVSYAVVHGVDDKRGHLVLKFQAGSVPRFNVVWSSVLIKKVARTKFGEDPRLWSCSLRMFLEDLDAHSSLTSIMPLYKLKTRDREFVYVGCGGISNDLFLAVKRMVAAGRTIRMLIYKAEPPTRYLANLRDYIQESHDDPVLLAQPRQSYDEWRPELLAYDEKDSLGIPQRLIKALDVDKTVVLQGPPGTGKSFCAAHVIADYLSRGKAVCVTAMANKALIELVLQPPLRQFLRDRKLSKTMLSPDEAIAAQGLQDADGETIVAKGCALFTTYYKFSSQFRRIDETQGGRIYDLVVVEEASQAYLTTIAGSIRMGERVLVVGDPMQLSPIVEKENKVEYKQWNVPIQANGLSSYVLGTSVKSFRITTTFRLTSRAAKLTGLFYGNTLCSVSPKEIDWSAVDSEFFPQGGGTFVKLTDGGSSDVFTDAAESIMATVVAKLRIAKKTASLAIVTPFKDTVKAIQNSAKIDFGELDVSVETIDRVQGATVDYAIIYLPLRNVGFAFEPKRFNVATSRSRTTTLIISDYDPLAMGSVTGKVRQYLMQAMGPDRQAHDIPAVSEKVSLKVLNKNVDPLMPAVLEVRQKMDVVQARLGQWLEGWLTIVYPTDVWKNAVAKNLSEIQYQNARQRGIRKIIDLDLNALLSVFLGNFRDLQSVSHMEDEMQSLAHLVRNIRHDYSHIRTSSLVTPKIQQMQYHLDDLSQFLDGLDATAPEPKKVAAPKTIVKKAGMTIIAS